MYKQTIGKAIDIVGIGLHSGIPVNMKLIPAKSETQGVVFIRTDKNIKIPVNFENVVDTKLATVVGREGAIVSTIEHLLSALTAFGIDNITIEIDNDEVPIMDGSSAPFCMVLEEAGIVEQKSKKEILVVKQTVEIEDNGRFVRVSPSDENIFDFEIKFDHPAIKRQKYSFKYSVENYIDEISRARTFGFTRELNYLKSIGKGKGADLNNVIGLDDKRVLNSEGLRFKDEFVRHKILDAIGDMSFIQKAFLGRYESFAGSHHLNHLLTKKLLADPKNYEILQA
ncbi:MAG: UDP-3-O-acyl-N-acetylglucosamine deacetylase [Campylobacterales bacterium]|nr:UDP-3-O-acyl-N-acetylglucosamine deacetylase [Campylobacterales bacterium]